MNREHLSKAIEAIGRNYNKRPEWAADSLPAWWHQLKRYSDSDMSRAVNEIIRTRTRCPTVATVCALIEASPNMTPREGPQGCPACEDTGQRELSKWSINTHGAPVVVAYLAACDCDKGHRLSAGAYADYREVLRAWQADPATREVYVADARTPKLPLWQRVDPATLERLQVPEDMQRTGALPGDWARLVGGDQ